MEIDNELHRLAGGIEVPAASPYDDLARGRKRLARRRAGLAGVGAASLAVAAVIGGVALVGSDGGGRAGDQSVAAGPDATSSAAPSNAPTDLTGATALATVRDRHDDAAPKDDDAAVQLWRDVLAEHLDPSGIHLEKNPSNMQGGGDASGGVYLGTKLGWSVPGEKGLGMVQIGVASTRAALDGWWDCPATSPHPKLDCALQTDASSGTVFSLSEKDGVTEVVVKQAPDRWVFLHVDPLFGNNSEVALPDMLLQAQELVEAASDSRLQLPTP